MWHITQNAILFICFLGRPAFFNPTFMKHSKIMVYVILAWIGGIYMEGRVLAPLDSMHNKSKLFGKDQNEEENIWS